MVTLGQDTAFMSRLARKELKAAFDQPNASGKTDGAPTKGDSDAIQIAHLLSSAPDCTAL